MRILWLGLLMLTCLLSGGIFFFVYATLLSILMLIGDVPGITDFGYRLLTSSVTVIVLVVILASLARRLPVRANLIQVAAWSGFSLYGVAMALTTNLDTLRLAIPIGAFLAVAAVLRVRSNHNAQHPSAGVSRDLIGPKTDKRA